MVTQILGPKNALSDRTTSFHRRTNKIKNRPKPTKEKKPKKTNNDVKKSNLVNGQVTLLRRGESLSSIKFQEPALKLVKEPVFNLVEPGFNVEKPGLDLVDFVPNRIVVPPVVQDVVFAGMGFTSPSPRKVPFPSVLMRKREEVDDEVSKDLRRMLRLE